ncbi:MAG: DUF5670 family protein [Bacteroidota bacterium]|nr:DUF5670 family protein [Bacteroidota bacterium]
MKKNYTFLFILIWLVLINGCSNARYTGLKSYQYSDDYNKPKVVKVNSHYIGEKPTSQFKTTVDSTHTDSCNFNTSIYKKEKAVNIKHENQAEKKSIRNKKEKKLVKNTRKPKDIKPYQGPKNNVLLSTFSLNAALLWTVGFFFFGIGSLIHILLAIALILAIIAKNKK